MTVCIFGQQTKLFKKQLIFVQKCLYFWQKEIVEKAGGNPIKQF